MPVTPRTEQQQRRKGVTVGANGRDMSAPHAARRLTKTERLARELMERRESIPRPLLAALLITLIDEAERRKRVAQTGGAVPDLLVEEDEQRG